jgi:nitroreductase
MTNQDFLHAIEKRVAIRTYQKEVLTREQISKIKSIINKYQAQKGPFDNKFEFTFNLNNAHIDGKKIGTYGFIKNAPAFIGGIANNEKSSLIDFGYNLENICLELVHNDFDTCFIGGTFKRSQFRKQLEENQIIPCILALGHKDSERSFIDRLIKKNSQVRKRKQLEENFISLEGQSLSASFKEIFSYVRQAPSALNRQPWLFIIDQMSIHVFVVNNKKSSKIDFRFIDIGIALKHLEISLLSKNFPVKRVHFDAIEKPGYEYVISYNISK